MNTKIVTAEGKVIGHVADIELSKDHEYRVTALYFGTRGWLHRLHLVNPFLDRAKKYFKPDKVPWNAVDHVEPGVVRLKRGYEHGDRGEEDNIPRR